MKTLLFINGLRIANYILLFSYISLLIGFGWFKDERRMRYRKLLNTVFTFGIGILLISLQYPLITRVKEHPKETSHLMFSAGLIVLTTIHVQDIKDVLDFIFLSS
tara:strand:+ start:3476 stop:3790 length:315 start_codon:yes stop_codon:yes gene_type:complete